MHGHFEFLATQTTDARERQKLGSSKDMVLYKMGDTRMLSLFRMLARIVFCTDILAAFFTDPRYDVEAQKVIKNYNASASADKKIKKRSGAGGFVDLAKDTFGTVQGCVWMEQGGLH